VGRKTGLRQVDVVAREFNMTPEVELEFRQFIHDCKESGYRGTANDRGDFTLEELRSLAREFPDLKDE
jgi:hypothetical protein